MIHISVPYSHLTWIWDRKWTASLYPSFTSRPCLDGLSIFYPITKNNKVSCEYGTLIWIIAVLIRNHSTAEFEKKMYTKTLILAFEVSINCTFLQILSHGSLLYIVSRVSLSDYTILQKSTISKGIFDETRLFFVTFFLQLRLTKILSLYYEGYPKKKFLLLLKKCPAKIFSTLF